MLVIIILLTFVHYLHYKVDRFIIFSYHNNFIKILHAG